MYNRAMNQTTRLCSVEGCGRPSRALGFCPLHYQRNRNNGNPIVTRRNLNGTGTIVKAPKARAGYVFKLIFAFNPYRGKKLQIAEHIHIAETVILKRRLLPGEVVHHKDHNTLNNDPSNLEVLTRAEHARIHRLLEAAGVMPRRKRKKPDPPSAT